MREWNLLLKSCQLAINNSRFAEIKIIKKQFEVYQYIKDTISAIFRTYFN